MMTNWHGGVRGFGVLGLGVLGCGGFGVKNIFQLF